MSEWQPIETAPKDGTKIIVFTQPRAGDKPAVDVVRWEPHGAGHNRGAWLICGEYAPYGAKVTHWMPLPKPPAE